MTQSGVKSCPRIIITGTSGDSGKTLVSVGLLAGLRQQGHKLTAFKKGPDFIDPAWLNAAGGTTVRNLDTFLVEKEKVYRSFVKHAVDSGVNIIEGNRGLYDGLDSKGSHSTAELARLLNAPVILVCNVTKSTRTVAALVLGMKELDKNVNIAGVIINQVGGKRHKKIVTESIEEICGIPVVGAIPRVKDEKLLPSRHLGLVTPAEYSDHLELIERLGKLVTENTDLGRIVDIACGAPGLKFPVSEETEESSEKHVRIGYFSDSAFTFYYPENLEALQRSGAELIPISSLEDKDLPAIDGLYIGGGFPETHADKLAGNRELMEHIKSLAKRGLPIYAECGGLIYLCRSLTLDDQKYLMAGLFDVDLLMSKKPAGHGYSLMTVDTENPFFPLSTEIRGHEFHYTYPAEQDDIPATVLTVRKGSGLGNGRDAMVFKNVWAGYIHIHADGMETWADNFVQLVGNYRDRNFNQHGGGAINLRRKAV